MGKTKRKQEEEAFEEGSLVEVCSDEDGYRGAWYEAKILKMPAFPNNKRKDQALVQYQHLLADDNHSTLLTEYVKLSFVRPLPPSYDSNQCVEPYDVVDAYYSDGWWQGVVSKVVKDQSSYKRYTVVFDDPPDMMEFSPSDLRFHFDWVNAKWVHPKKQKRMKGLKFKIGMAVEVNRNKGYYPVTIVEEVGFNSYLVKYTNSDTMGDSEGIVEETVDSFDIRPVPPKSKVKRFDLLVKVEAFCDLAWRAGFITRILEHNSYIVQLKDENKERQFNHSEIRPRLRLLNGKWVCNSKETNEQNEENTSPQSKGEEHIKAEVGVTEMDIECCEAEEVELPEVTGAGPAGEEHIQAEVGVTQMDIECCEAQGIELPEVTGAGPAGSLDTSKRDSIREISEVDHGTKENFLSGVLPEGTISPGTSCQLSDVVINQQDALLSDEAVDSTVEMESLPNALVKSQQLSKAGEDTVEDTAEQNSFDEIVEVEHTAKELDSTVSGAHSFGGEHTKTSCQVPGKEISLQNDEDINWQQKGKECKTAGSSVIEMDYEACATEEVELLGVACSRLTGHSPGSGVKQNQVNDSETSMQSPVVNVGVSRQLVENGDTPFEKCSPLWEKIESLEVFRVIPQKPHFQTLMRHKELNREGFALGNMINFASLVEKTCKLQVEDPRDVINGYLDALSDLEIHGFDVKPVAKRLNELVLIKDRQEELQNRLKENETEFTKVSSEKTNAEKDIDALDEKIRMLKERQAMNKSMKVCNDSKIASLELDDSVLSEHISKAQQEFESLATSSW